MRPRINAKRIPVSDSASCLKSNPTVSVKCGRKSVDRSSTAAMADKRQRAGQRQGEKNMGTKTSEFWKGHPGADPLMHFPPSTKKVCSRRLVITSNLLKCITLLRLHLFHFSVTTTCICPEPPAGTAASRTHKDMAILHEIEGL